MSQEPRPDTVENEFREATRPIFHQHSATAKGAEAYDGAASADPRELDASVNEGSDTFEAVVDAVSATDSQSFLLGLIAALGRTPRSPAVGESSLGAMLRQLGRALDEDLEEEPAFQVFVDALERRRFGAHALQEAVPIVAAFVARIVSEPARVTGSSATPAEIAGLVPAAAQIAREALDSGGARSWRVLPEIAATIARRAAQRGSTIVTLAEALPRLWARLGPRPRDAYTSEPDHLPGRTKGETRRMVLSGPVEIVILER